MPYEETRRFYVGIGIIVALNLAFAAFHIFGVLAGRTHVLIADAYEVVGPLCCLFVYSHMARSHDETYSAFQNDAGSRQASRLLMLGVGAYLLAGLVRTSLDVALKQPPFPSWADAGYLVAFSLLIASALRLLTHGSRSSATWRLLLDALIIIVAVAAFAWFSLLGPIVLQAGTPLLSKAVSTVYLLFDLVLLYCFTLLWPALRPYKGKRTVGLLSLGLGAVIIANSIVTYQQLRGSSTSHALLDIVWTSGWSIVLVAARSIGDVKRAPAGASAARQTMPSIIRLMTPYVEVLLLGVLSVILWAARTDWRLDIVVWIAMAMIVVMVMMRQILVLNEVRRTHVDTNLLAEANVRLGTMETSDGLTGLANRMYLRDRVEQALLLSPYVPTSIGLLLMDLDGFKNVNDTLGHHAGDRLLQLVAERVGAALPRQDLLARLGGDEFAILLPSADATRAQVIARTVMKAMADPFGIDGHLLDVHGSIGIALAPDHGSDADTLLRHADIAMYLAKNEPSSYALYDSNQDRHSERRLTLSSELRRSLRLNKLELHFQPLMDVRLERLIGVEVLTRWRHPLYGFIPPDQFIPLAEQTDLIGPLTHWVLQNALSQVQQWHGKGLHVPVSVNLSARNLQDASLPETVRSLLERYAVPPAHLVLEITESALMVDPERALSTLSGLKELGVQVAIDDFGTGYSSLGYLKHLPVDEIKIDKSFVLGMEDGGKDAAIVRSVVAMAHALGLSVVAEGVENQRVLIMLEALHCDVVQGYYISRALLAKDLERWIGDRTWTQEAQAALNAS